VEQLHLGVVLAGRETRTLPVAVYNVLTFEQLLLGAACRRGARSSCCRWLILTIIIQREIVTGMAAGG